MSWRRPAPEQRGTGDVVASKSNRAAKARIAAGVAGSIKKRRLHVLRTPGQADNVTDGSVELRHPTVDPRQCPKLYQQIAAWKELRRAAAAAAAVAAYVTLAAEHRQDGVRQMHANSSCPSGPAFVPVVISQTVGLEQHQHGAEEAMHGLEAA